VRSGSHPQSKKPLLLALALLSFSLVLLYFDRRGDQPGPIGKAIVWGVSPVRQVVSSAGQTLRDLWLNYLALVNTQARNRALERELQGLKERAAQSADLVAENERLHRLLELADRRKDLRLKAAYVVSRSLSPFFRVLGLTLDLEGEQAQAGMPVIAPGGIVGHLRLRVGPRAEVMLLTDPRSAIDVVLEQSRARGVAVGTGEADRYTAQLKYLEHSNKAILGERVITTGDDGRYPRGLVVGEIISVNQDTSSPFQGAQVRPLVDLNALDEVFVILGLTGLNPKGTEFKGIP